MRSLHECLIVVTRKEEWGELNSQHLESDACWERDFWKTPSHPCVACAVLQTCQVNSAGWRLGCLLVWDEKGKMEMWGKGRHQNGFPTCFWKSVFAKEEKKKVYTSKAELYLRKKVKGIPVQWGLPSRPPVRHKPHPNSRFHREILH